MSMIDYQHALRNGEKELKTLRAAGQDPYLVCLETVLRPGDGLNEVSVGVTEIQMDQIAGTKTPSRRTAFSASFWPVQDEKSEFATKWARLASAHVSEGIHEPVKAVEYLNSFYIVEGHKRVSVLKYFGARAVPASVTRILPQRSEEPRIQAYYEYIEFYRVTGISMLVFRLPGKYPKLLRLLSQPEEADSDAVPEEWDLFRRRELTASVVRFREALRTLGLQRELDADECLLRYLLLHDYGHLRACSPSELRSELQLIVPELRSESRDLASDLQLEADAVQPQKGLLDWLLKPEVTSLRIAFLHDKNPEISQWTAAHERGRQQLQERLGTRIETVSCFDMLEKNVPETLEKLAAQGYDMVFTTTPRLLQATVQAAAKFPKTKFLNCSLNVRHPLIRTYYGRMYEAKFLTGIIAGAVSRTGRIAYLCNYPIYGMAASINAFAIGVRMVNPDATVYLEWSTIPGNDYMEHFRQNSVDVVSGQDTYVLENSNRDFGLFRIENGERRRIAQSVWRWGTFYERIVHSVFDSAWESLAPTETSGRAINYWWGLASSVIDVEYNDGVPVQTSRLVELLRRNLADGSFRIFEGPLKDNLGNERIAMGCCPDPWEMVHMDYLAYNVVGSFPEPETLNESAQALMRIQGVHTAPEERI